MTAQPRGRKVLCGTLRGVHRLPTTGGTRRISGSPVRTSNNLSNDTIANSTLTPLAPPVSAMRPPQPLLAQYHQPFTLPTLPYRSSPLAPPPVPSTSSDPPSSPTATSFYPTLPAPSRPPPRAHKSHSSTRHSSPSSLRAQTLENARLARKPMRAMEEVERSGNPFVVGMYGSGGMRDGVWEEYTDEEEVVLGRTGALAARRERELVRERGEDEAWGLERLAEEEEEEQGTLALVLSGS